MAATLACLIQRTTAAAEPSPNVIVIFTDDHGYSDLSCQGVQNDLKTPHIDALAAGGVRMESGYVSAPQCVPSRGGILSGRYQNRFGLESNGLPLDGFNRQLTIGERLKKKGYATGMTGKWHLGPANEIHQHGFDDVYAKNSARPGWANFSLDGKDRPAGAEDTKLYHLDANSAAACAFIKRHHDRPFFFYCAYRAPHVPLDAPPAYLKRFPGKMPERRRQALAMLSAIDDGVGKMMATLREYHIEEQTLIFLIGDNGAPLKIHKLDAPGGGPGWDGSLNEPFNGEKGMLAEGGVRVPFLVYWKGTIPGGQVYTQPVISLDVAATATALAGLPDDPQLDGVNLVPFLTGESKGVPHETLYWRWIAQSAVREGRWKYLRGGQREYLFDLESDAEELINLAAKNPDTVERLRGKLVKWADEQSPKGLATKAMSPTWERYFDHYLDGKLAPLPPPVADNKTSVQGWVPRSASLNLDNRGLRITPSAKTKRAFITANGLRFAGPLQVRVRFRATKGGRLGISWRESSQKDFPPGQVASVDVEPTDEFVEHTIPLETDDGAQVIHMRLLLPIGPSEIQRLSLHNAKGKVVKTWDFTAR